MDAKEFVRTACAWASENRGVIWLVCGNGMELAVRRLLFEDGWDVRYEDEHGAPVPTHAHRDGFADIQLHIPVRSGQFGGMAPPNALLVDGFPLVVDENEIATWLAVVEENGKTRTPVERVLEAARVEARAVLFVSSPVLLTEREVGAGTDPASGIPSLDLTGLRALGIDAPNQRYLLSPEAAIRVGSALLAAADPTLVPALLRLASAERPLPGGQGSAVTVNAGGSGTFWELGAENVPGDAIQVMLDGRPVWKLP